MIDIKITNNNLFMNSLLKGDLFDNFEVREISLHTLFRSTIDGKRNKEFTKEGIASDSSDYIKWAEVKHHVFNLIKGDISPSSLKIVLSSSKEYSENISDNISAFFLNIHYTDSLINCTTGAAHKTFTLEKDNEKIWDDKIKKFLISNNLA